MWLRISLSELCALLASSPLSTQPVIQASLRLGGSPEERTVRFYRSRLKEFIQELMQEVTKELEFQRSPGL